MRRVRTTNRRAGIVIFAFCVGATTGALLRIVTAPTSAWIYTIIASLCLGAVTTTLFLWMFTVFDTPFLTVGSRIWCQRPLSDTLFKVIYLTLGIIIVASYVTMIYTMTAGLYDQAMIATLSFVVLMVVGALISRKHDSFQDTLVMYLLFTLLIAAIYGLVFGGLFGLSLAVLLLILDTLFHALTHYWILSGILCSAIWGALVGTKL